MTEGSAPPAFEHRSCRDHNPNWWFPILPWGDKYHDTTPTPDNPLVLMEGRKMLAHEAALLLCRRCPHREPCRDWALTQGRNLSGIWGGTTEYDRNKIRRSRRGSQGQ